MLKVWWLCCENCKLGGKSAVGWGFSHSRFVFQPGCNIAGCQNWDMLGHVVVPAVERQHSLIPEGWETRGAAPCLLLEEGGSGRSPVFMGCVSRNGQAPAARVKLLLKRLDFSSAALALLGEEHADGNPGQPCETFPTQGQCFHFPPERLSITVPWGRLQPQSPWLAGDVLERCPFSFS